MSTIRYFENKDDIRGRLALVDNIDHEMRTMDVFTIDRHTCRMKFEPAVPAWNGNPETQPEPCVAPANIREAWLDKQRKEADQAELRAELAKERALAAQADAKTTEPESPVEKVDGREG